MQQIFPITHFLPKQKKILVIAIVLEIVIIILTIFIGIQIGKAQPKPTPESIPDISTDLPRMNGVAVVNQQKEVTLDDNSSIPENQDFTLTNLNSYLFDETNLEYKGVIRKLTTNIDDSINLSIEITKNESPYLAIHSPSEWLAVTSVKDYVYHLITYTPPDPSIYNTSINGVPFSKKYIYFQPGIAISLSYKTAVLDPSRENIIYYNFSAYTDISSLSDKDFAEAKYNPEKWFANNPNEDFQKLEKFLNQNITH